ncbi:MAG: hypothetical protein GY849_15195 [Deltaproteobacteria bacterium]|nr:hypothetical protein [Deltaproteobacteria bacterium]
MRKKRMMGFRVIMTMGIVLVVMLLLGQMMSFINYDFTVSIGLQESSDKVGKLGVALNKGFGVGDTIVYTPLLVIGLIGLWLRKMWGVFAMVSALAITAYWPMVTLFFLLFAQGVPGFNITGVTMYATFLVPITIYGIWGVWFLYRNQRKLVSE